MTIRPAGEADLAEVLAMIHELAEFEELSAHVVCTLSDLRAAVLGDDRFVHVSLAVADDGAIAGQALWYPTFSTFLGRPGIWLEDLFVREGHRRQGHARALMASLRERSPGRVEWDVLDWNRPAVQLYEALGARPLRGWTTYRWEEPEESAGVGPDR